MLAKNKVKVTEENYREIVLKRAIILCWVILLICFVIKLFGGDFFNIEGDYGNFAKLCNFIDGTIIKYICYYILFNISMFLVLIMAIPEIKIKSKNFLIYLIVANITWIYKLLIDLGVLNFNTIVINVIDFIIYFIILTLLSRKILRPLITLSLLFLFSFISALTKNIELDDSITNSYLVTIIFSIDYYIMLAISALYSKIKYIRRTKQWD